MGIPNPNFRIPYAGGVTPLVLDLNELLHNVALTFDGFDSSQAVVEVRAIGAAPTVWKTVTVATVERTMKILQTPLTQVRISGLSAGTYFVTAFQW